MRNLLLATASLSIFAGGLVAPAPAFAQQAAGSFQGSCRNAQSSNGVLTAECADSNGRYHVSSIASGQCRGDIGNNNGMLTCNGATATGGALVGNQNDNGQRSGNNNNNNALAAGAVGVVVGALAGNALANRNNNQTQLYAPGYAYPTYGDQQYGNPQYDPRYAQGGYAYGRPARQWVSITDRAPWLNQRINRGVQEGTLDRSEVVSLRNQLADIQNLERRYQRQGMQTWMRADLDKRFDQLAARIQYERTDGDNVRGRVDNRNSQGDPDLARLETRIQQQIREGEQYDLIQREDANDLQNQLRDIQSREQIQYRRSGYRLSDYDRRAFTSELNQLERQVDYIRNEP
jgi:hypothetical protein